MESARVAVLHVAGAVGIQRELAAVANVLGHNLPRLVLVTTEQGAKNLMVLLTGPMQGLLLFPPKSVVNDVGPSTQV